VRRRGRTLEQAIFDAVVEQMNATGFAGLTMEGVAAGARTGKAALYRRWQCKEDLVVDALNHALPSFESQPDTGNLRDDIVAVMGQMLDVINSNAGTAIINLMGELDRDHEFAKTLHARVLAPRKTSMHTIIERAADRGELERTAVSPFVVEAGPALVLHHLFCYGPPIDRSVAEAIVDEVVLPLLHTHRTETAADPKATRAKT
jgi:AcrR family transcriptional regulator